MIIIGIGNGKKHSSSYDSFMCPNNNNSSILLSLMDIIKYTMCVRDVEDGHAIK